MRSYDSSDCTLEMRSYDSSDCTSVFTQVFTSTCPSTVYAFGITLFELISREEPYRIAQGETFESILPLVASPGPEGRILRPDIPESCPTQLRNVMTDCWSFEPQSRPSFEQLKSRVSALDFTACGFGPGRMRQLLFDTYPRHVSRQAHGVRFQLVACTTVEPRVT
jgi:hypothetical protein